jgi:hypothetical protein
MPATPFNQRKIVWEAVLLGISACLNVSFFVFYGIFPKNNNMNKLLRLLPLSVIVLLVASGCQKDEVTENPMDHTFNISLSRNALEYVNIPVGKYFIYRVTGNSLLDSIRVVSNQLDTVNMPRNNNINFPEHNIERFRLKMDKYQVPIMGTGVLISEWVWSTTVPTPYNPYDSSSTADVRLEFTGAGAGQLIFYGTHNLSPTETIVVEGVTYTGVIRTESNNGLTISNPNYQKNVFYWARGLGVIKRITTSFNGYEVTRTLLRHN